MSGEDRILLALAADRERRLAEEAVRVLVSAGMVDDENRALYAAAAQRIRDRLREAKRRG
jgi:hypothetical protein